MADRRTLIEAMKPPAPPVDPNLEKKFVYGEKSKEQVEAANPSTVPPTLASTQLSTRIRSDFFDSLKRASLERQLKKVEPNTLREILEEAIEPWLKLNGYLP